MGSSGRLFLGPNTTYVESLTGDTIYTHKATKKKKKKSVYGNKEINVTSNIYLINGVFL